MTYKYQTPAELVAGPWTVSTWGEQKGWRYEIPEVMVSVGIKIGGSGPVPGAPKGNDKNWLIDPDGAAAIVALIRGAPELRDALQRMVKMHDMMMEKVNHRASFYDAATIKEMNEAPLQAQRILNDIKHLT